MIRLCCDPFAMALEAANALYPDINVVIQWDSSLGEMNPCMTKPGGGSRPWFVMLSPHLHVEAALAGVVGGIAQAVTDEMETPAWRECCDRIFTRFGAIQKEHKHASLLWGDKSREELH